MSEQLWENLCITLQKGVGSLGAGLGIGCYRNTKVMIARIKGLAARTHRFRMFKNVGVDTSMLLRTG